MSTYTKSIVRAELVEQSFTRDSSTQSVRHRQRRTPS